MDEEKQLSEEESLKLITQTIHEAQGYFYESGKGPLTYGFSIIVYSVLTYVREENIFAFPFHPFYLLIPVIFIQAWIQVKEEKKKKAKTFTDQTIDYVWLGFFISALAAWCANFAGLEYTAVAIILFVTAMATFLTGMVAKFKYSIIAGCICWLVAILSFFLLTPAIYLLLGATAVLVWVIPGFILRFYFKKLQHAGR
jgi:hypothetical protein